MELLKQCPIQCLIQIATDDDHGHHMKTIHVYVTLSNSINNDDDYKENCDYKTLIETNDQRKVNWPGL